MRIETQFSKKTSWQLAGLAIMGLVCFCFFDRTFASWRIIDGLPGDAKVLLEMFSYFGHGVGCFVAILLIWNLDSARRNGIPLVIAATVLAGITTSIMKVCFQRPRPFYEALPNVEASFTIDPNLYNNALQSFPSGHTATAFAMAGALSVLYPHGRRMFVWLAVIVAVQRVVTQNHFPSDVFVGAIIGIVASILAHTAYQRLSASSTTESTARQLAVVQHPNQKCA